MRHFALCQVGLTLISLFTLIINNKKKSKLLIEVISNLADFKRKATLLAEFWSRICC